MIVDEVGMGKISQLFREDVRFLEVEGINLENLNHQMLVTPITPALEQVVQEEIKQD